jgi:hypothetical protein
MKLNLQYEDGNENHHNSGRVPVSTVVCRHQTSCTLYLDPDDCWKILMLDSEDLDPDDCWKILMLDSGDLDPDDCWKILMLDSEDLDPDGSVCQRHDTECANLKDADNFTQQSTANSAHVCQTPETQQPAGCT